MIVPDWTFENDERPHRAARLKPSKGSRIKISTVSSVSGG